mgnify:CR=1 FL=1
MRPTEQLIKQLNLDILNLNINYMANGFCSIMARDGRCGKQKDGTCDKCTDLLRALIESDIESAENKNAVIMWRMNQYAKGKIDVWYSPPKKLPTPEDQYVDPLKKFREVFHLDDFKPNPGGEKDNTNEF